MKSTFEKRKLKAYNKKHKQEMKFKIDNKKILIKPMDFLNEEIKKEELREERKKRKNGTDN